MQREQQIQDPVADDSETHVTGFVTRDAEVGDGGAVGLEGFPEEPGILEFVADGCFAGVGFVEVGGEGVLEGGAGEVGGERVLLHCRRTRLVGGCWRGRRGGNSWEVLMACRCWVLGRRLI